MAIQHGGAFPVTAQDLPSPRQRELVVRATKRCHATRHVKDDQWSIDRLEAAGMSLNPSVPRGVAPPSPDTRIFLNPRAAQSCTSAIGVAVATLRHETLLWSATQGTADLSVAVPKRGGGRGWRRGSSVPPRTRTSVVVATAPRGRGPHGNGPRPPEGRGPSSRLLNGPPLTDGALISRLPIEQPLCRYPRRNCGQSLTRIGPNPSRPARMGARHLRYWVHVCGHAPASPKSHSLGSLREGRGKTAASSSSD